MKNPWINRAAIIIITSVGYFYTVSRTVSLWDCGEFIAAIHILGIPHPPGTPFFMLLGKTWELMLFFIPHVAFRINLLSVFCSVSACLLLYEITCIFTRQINLRESLINPCGFTAALLLAFSNTFWFNAVEAEVYALSMVGMLISVWSICKWEQAGRKLYSKWIVLLVYVSFLGIGVQMYAMLFTPILLFFIGVSSHRVVPGKWLFSIIILIACFLIAGFINPANLENKGLMVIFFLLLSFGLVMSVKMREVRDLSFCLVSLLLCAVIALTMPFIVGGALAAGALSLVMLLYKWNSIKVWFLSFFSVLLCITILYIVPVPWTEIFTLKNTGLVLTLALTVGLVTSCLSSCWKSADGGTAKTEFCLLLLLVAFIGYSTHIYIPVRSRLEPAIDENDPESWEQVQAFLERRQYGSENMLLRMFERRGKWSNQLGFGHHMGYFKYHSSQLVPSPVKNRQKGIFAFHTWHKFLASVMLLLSLWVLVENINRNRRWIMLILCLYLISSVGLLLYMNFADGERIDSVRVKHWKQSARKIHAALTDKGLTIPAIPDPNKINDIRKVLKAGKQDTAVILKGRAGVHFENWRNLSVLAAKHRMRYPDIPSPVHAEVRNRDYFYTPAFMIFMLIFSVVIFLGIEKVGHIRYLKKPSLVIGNVISLVLWCVPFFLNLEANDRKHDYTGSDFAWNVLNSCPPDAVLFTNGDNDTFPLWYMQQVEDVRKDVTVINFSLANMNWYNQQLTYLEPVVRLPSIERGGSFPRPQYIYFKQPQKISVPGDTSISFQFGGVNTPVLVRTQDRVLIETVINNHPRRPVCFTLSTPNSSSIGLEKHFSIPGLLYELSSNPGIDLERLDKNLFSNFRYGFLEDKHFSESEKRIINSYKRLVAMGKRKHLVNLQLTRDKMEREREVKIISNYTELENSLSLIE